MNTGKCKSLIRKIEKDKKQKKILLKEIRNILSGYKNGDQIFRQLKQKIDQDDYREAIVLVSNLSKPFWAWNRTWKTIVFLFFIFLAAGGMFTLSIDLYNSLQCKNWKETAGIVIESGIKESHDEESTIYRAEIIYTYTVNNVSYTSERRTFNDIAYGERLGGKKIAAGIVRRYPPDGSVTVYYNPDNPRLSVLEIGDIPWISSIAGIVVCIIAMIVVSVLYISDYRKQ